ncbi:ABC transporter ATP-binding protein [Thermospira aquatica]|uniref:ATP-binding cassette domain-containing protein n=1 Tax=Thermospira aquatica TaxID=2828656 RepID=A0AAX3BH35_9SPIR|nr:ATP-binding cassette domain-containing protein [Thermospira aquatica]URA10771.1 ATP-binding cassette domain-containing protein [Thermospira aquatica]
MADMIEVYDLYKTLNKKKVLDGLTVKIKKGETFVLIGQSGVGKSVLLKHLIGLMRPDSGEIYIDGIKLDYDNPEILASLRCRFGMLFQGGALFDSLTVGENILFALDHLRPEMHQEEKKQRMLRSLELVELPGVEDLMISSLSGGMMKRVALARAIVAEPEIVLFDEPTTGLDPITTATINDLIIELKKKLAITFVVVTHDIRSAFFIGDRIGMLYKGKLIFEGTPQDFQHTENPYVRQFVEGLSKGPITEEYQKQLHEKKKEDKTTGGLRWKNR